MCSFPVWPFAPRSPLRPAPPAACHGRQTPLRGFQGGAATDVYAFGITLCVMMTPGGSRGLWPQLRNVDFLFKVAREDFRPPLPPALAAGGVAEEACHGSTHG